MPPHPVLLALEAQRRPSIRPSSPSSPSTAPERPSLPSLPSIEIMVPWSKIAVAALVIPALFAVATWLYYG